MYDISDESLEVTEHGTDEAAALDAYEADEALHRDDDNFDVVLIGADSLETIRTTHASYFGGAAQRLAELLGPAHRNTVSVYQHRYLDMPRPVREFGDRRAKLWLRSEIDRWRADVLRRSQRAGDDAAVASKAD